MTTETLENVQEDLADDGFYAADDLPEDVSAGQKSAEIPDNWVRDRVTGEMRPPKPRGRKPHITGQPSPGEDELRAGAPIDRPADAPPPDKRHRAKPPPAAVPPMPKGGVLASGINVLYRRAGKMLRAWDEDLGEALIACTHGDDDEITVGEAWEALCKVNPRVRAFWLRLISGNTYGDLVMAHLPIGIALMHKSWFRRLVPVEKLAGSMLEPDEDTKPGDLRPTDVEEMRDLAQQQAQRMAEKMGFKGTVPADVVDRAMAEAQQQAAPPGLRQQRQQPQRQSRAGRKGR